jgi:hypothetical protein
LLSFNEGGSQQNSGDPQDFMESVYDFESSAFSIGDAGSNLENGSRIKGKENSSKRHRILAKIDKPQMDMLSKEKGKKHFMFFKALLEYLNLVDKLQNLYDKSNHKTILYLLTLLVNRIESWNSIVLGALKKNKKYFSQSKENILEFIKRNSQFNVKMKEDLIQIKISRN